MGIEAINKVTEEAEARPFVRLNVPLLSVDPTKLDSDAPGIPGSLTVLLGSKQNPHLTAIAQAAAVDDVAEAHSFVTKLMAEQGDRPEQSLEDAAANAVTHNSLADIRYGSKTLAMNLPIPDQGVTAVSFPYNGGPIDPGDLQIVEKHKGEPQIQAAALLNHPVLNDAERRALDLVTGPDSEAHLGVASSCYALTAVGVAATVIAATGLCRRGDDAQIHRLNDGDIERLGPLGTAVDLLNTRRSMLGTRAQLMGRPG